VAPKIVTPDPRADMATLSGQARTVAPKIVTPDPRADMRTFSSQGRKEVPVVLKEKSRQEEPVTPAPRADMCTLSGQARTVAPKIVTPDPRADMCTLSGPARKEAPIAPKIKSSQKKPIQERAQREKCQSQSPAGLNTLATLCSGLTTNSVSAGTVSPT
jgi:hypothetical protein